MAGISVKPAVAIGNLRALAARAVAAVFAGSNLDHALERESAHLSAADRALLHAITYGVMRERRALEWLVTQLLDKPLRQEPVLEALLLCGLQQLRGMRVAPHAAVAETVNAAAVLDKPWAKGLVNAVLRRYQREQTALEAALPSNPELRWSYPKWLIDAIRRDWPYRWREILAAGNAQGPLTLRVNRRRGSREAYLAELGAAGIAATAVAHAPDAVMLADALPVERIPGFVDGRVSVQDAAAQLAVDLLDAQAGMRVLDACAAPGGKTAHLLERVDDLDLLALDSAPARLPRVRETLDRLGLHAPLLEADAAQPSAWWLGKKFDRILCDAPCSGSGVIRRHPDIKWLRRDTDIAQMAAQQLRLLDALWPLLKPQGVLLYASCSILCAEGEDVLREFLRAHADAQEWLIQFAGDLAGDELPGEALAGATEDFVPEAPADAGWGELRGVGRRLAPGGAFDGFYYARLIKQP